MNKNLKVCVVDDDPIIQDLLEDQLIQLGYHVTTSQNGKEAWQALESHPKKYDLILLDWMLPGMYGIEVLKKIKEHPLLKTIPTIMMTAKSSKEDIQEGLDAGAYYYLTKPFERSHLLAIIKTAMTDFAKYRQLLKETEQTANTLRLMKKGEFSFYTLEEGTNIALLLAKAFPRPERVVAGLLELLINAVEHGNLGITYEEKSELIYQDQWRNEVEARLLLPENIEKTVDVRYEKDDHEIRFFVKDAGKGFDWQSYQEYSIERVLDNHGRGIIIAQDSFNSLEYFGAGNEICGVVKLK
ncbi:MAG: response regulator [SAR324 cluster bacterium]|nr:response regulator [SAR324 cluster bacterium]